MFGPIGCEVVMKITRSPFTQIFNSVTDNTNWNPAYLFSSGQLGFWYDPSDITTLFQDNLGVTPVTAAGQTVGRILDKSGNGYHATQATLAQRPLYQIDANGRPYLSFDGVDDNMVIPSIAISGTEPLFFCFGAQRPSRATAVHAGLFSFGKSGNTLTFPGFNLQIRGSGVPAYSPQVMTSSTTAAAFFQTPANSFGDIAKKVVSATRSVIRLNANGITTTGNTVDFSGFVTQFNRLGCTYANVNANFYIGGIYSAIFAAVPMITSQIFTAETWVNEKTGAY
jgi:hypothetical protein